MKQAHLSLNSLLLCLICIFLGNTRIDLSAQCTSNTALLNRGLFIYPGGDESGPIDTFACADFYAYLPVIVPDSFVYGGINTDITSFTITGIQGLPLGSSISHDSPDAYASNRPLWFDNIYHDLNVGCMSIFFPPVAPGDYQITITAMVNGNLPVTFGDNGFGKGRYILRVPGLGAPCLPNVSFNIDQCAGASSQLRAAESGRYLWSTGETMPFINVSPTSTTQYYLSTTLTNGNVVQSTYNVNVIPLPTVSISGPVSSFICPSANVPFQATGATSYVWSNDTRGASTTFMMYSSGMNTIEVTGIKNGCSNTASYDVSVTTVYAPFVSSSSNNICPGTAVTLTASGGVSYLWEDGSTLNSIATAPLNVDSIINVTVLDSNGCDAWGSVYVDVLDPSSYNLIVYPPVMCDNIPVTVTLVNGFGQLYSRPGFTNPFQISQPGVYQVTITDPSNSCSAINSTTITQTFGNCGGHFVLEADSMVNFFDTLTVRLKVVDGIDVYIASAIVSFDTTYLRFVSGGIGGYLGNNAPDASSLLAANQFRVSTSSWNINGYNGDGVMYEMKFVLDSIPSNLNFNPQNPESLSTLLSLGNIYVQNSRGTNLSSFIHTSVTATSTLMRYYVPVWPGDCDNNRRVDVADFVRIGAIHGTNGTTRSFTGNWTAQPTQLWGTNLTYPTGTAYDCFVDCNGDGTISYLDTTFVSSNLGLTHQLARPNRTFADPQYLNEEKTILPVIGIELPDSVVYNLNCPCVRTVTVTLGSAQTPINDIYGLAFDIIFDPSFVDVNGISLDYTGSVFGTLGSNFFKMEDYREKQNGRISIGLTGLNGLPTSANGGKILTMELPFINTPSQDWFRINAFPLAANTSNDIALRLASGTDSLRMEVVIGTDNVYQLETFTLSPNPTNGLVTLQLGGQAAEEMQAAVFDSYGRLVQMERITSTDQTFNVANLSNGVYWTKLQDGSRAYKPQKLVVQK